MGQEIHQILPLDFSKTSQNQTLGGIRVMGSSLIAQFNFDTRILIGEIECEKIPCVARLSSVSRLRSD